MFGKSLAQSLQKKVSATLLVVVAGFALLSYLVLNAVIGPAFDELEKAAARTDLARVENAIQADLDNLAAISSDWAPWDEIYSYVSGTNPAFEKSNLDRPTLENLDLDFLAVFSLGGRMVWSSLIHDGEARSANELEIFNAENAAAERLIEHRSPVSGTIGVVRTAHGIAMISSLPILHSDDSGPVAGSLVMGQFLDEDRLQRLTDRTAVGVSWYAQDRIADPTLAALLDGMQVGEMRVQTEKTIISSFRLLPDVRGEPLLLIQTTTPRRVSALGAQSVNVSLVFLAVAGILVTVAMWVLLQRTFLEPLEVLARHIGEIRASGDLTKRASVNTQDEIGELAQQFNRMTAELHDARQELVDQSFKAGKADTAAEVLHNIRNAMTPLINGLDRLMRSLGASEKLRVSESLRQVADPDCTPERREKFLEYLQASFDRISEKAEESATELKIVTAQAKQVEAILSDQERFANVAPVTEDLPVEDVVAEAAHVIPKDADARVRLDIDTDVNKFHVSAHRTGLLQVLGNLLLNAFESIQRSNVDEGEISLDASDAVVDDTPMVRLTIRDNGLGFSNDFHDRIFQRGFTSKEDGESNGLGLHWCANAVAGMGGRILAESRGEGQGAEFHVLLPAAQRG